MSRDTKIECVETTWNPITGCDEISLGCKNCYAKRLAKRLYLMKQPKYLNNFELTLHYKELETPLLWKKPRIVLVNSMSDVFHEKVPFEFLLEMFNTMSKSPHTFLLLTKRTERLQQLDSKLTWFRNIWLGVTIEHYNYLNRLNHLKLSSAYKKFITFEPLLSSFPKLNLEGIDWVIAGGESGYKARSMEESWIREIRDASVNHRIPFFFKQWSGFNKKKVGRMLDGKYWNEIPSFDSN